MKKDINYFYNYAKEKNIKIKEFTNKEKNLNGKCIYNTEKCNIYINNAINNEIEEKCILAEELGHYEVGILKNILKTDNYNMLVRSINEFRAKKWAVKELIPFDKFKQFLNTNYSKFDIANELEVTEELVDLACFVYEPMLYD